MLQNTPALEAARVEALQTPLEDFDMSKPERFQSSTHWPFFDRMRAEDPVHYCRDSDYGPYWSVTKWSDIMTVETNHRVFSSQPTIFIGDPFTDFQPQSFITSDEPRHSKWRKPVMPGVGPHRLDEIEALIRSRVGVILDELPRNEEFNWVEKVSVELTTQMLATLFDFPFEDRHLLPYWSDIVTATPLAGAAKMDEEERRKILMEIVATFTEMWRERAAAEQKFDFISLMAHHDDTKDIVDDPFTMLGNLSLLIVGGNDTTRNSISGGVLALNQFPDQYDRLRADPSIIPNMVKEIVRYQTPLSYMRRTALDDFEVGGKAIKKGDKVVMWYISGNRDEEKFDNAYDFDIGRANAKSHISFGFGVHRCMGNHVAEMQLRILWEEILQRFDKIEVVGPEKRVSSNFVMGIEELPVRIAA